MRDPIHQSAYLILALTAATIACQPASPARSEDSEAATNKDWSLRPGGLGRLQFGLTQSESARRLDLPGVAAPTVGGCRYWVPAGLPAGVRLMVEDGRVVRADVDSGTIKTTEGAGIGSSEAQVGQLYKGMVSQPHKYRSADGWHYLIYRPESAADSGSRIVFETDGQTVRSFRAGIEPAVEYVEGCG